MWDLVWDFVGHLLWARDDEGKSPAFWWTFGVGALLAVGGIAAFALGVEGLGVGLIAGGAFLIIVACVLEYMAWSP